MAGRPLLTSPGAALIGTPGAPSLTVPIAGLVLAVALAVALAATLVPAIRAARSSTVGALADAPRPPRRRSRLLAMSRRLPVPLLIGLRLVARRPRRALLGAANVAVTMAGVVAVLTFHATAGQKINGGGSGLSDPVYNRDEQVLLVLTIMLLTLAALNAIVTAWTTMLDTRHPAALARALGRDAARRRGRAHRGAAAAGAAGRVVRHPAGHRAVRGRGSRRADDRAARLVAGGRGAGDAGRRRGARGRAGARRRAPPGG